MPDPRQHDGIAAAEDQAQRERAWAARIAQGDEGAFADLFRAYFPALCTYAQTYVRSAALAEELVMDVFRRLWDGRENQVFRGSVRSYLFSAVKHGAIGHLRHVRVEQLLFREVAASLREPPAVGRGASGPVERVELAELAGAVSQAVEALPQKCRAVFLLWWQHDCTYAEIADALSISVKTVEGHLARANKLLRRRLAIFRP